MRTIPRKLENEDGVEILEAALVLPILLVFLLGIVWFGRAFNIYSTITQAAQQGAITAARPACATCTQASPWGSTSFPSDAAVDAAVTAVLQSSNLDPTQIQANPTSPPSCVNPPALAPCTSTNNITICRQALLNPTAAATQPNQCGMIVTFRYPFTSSLPFTSLNQQTIVLTAQAQSRTEN
jgi:hypothetical protein